MVKLVGAPAVYQTMLALDEWRKVADTAMNNYTGSEADQQQLPLLADELVSRGNAFIEAARNDLGNHVDLPGAKGT